MTLFEMIIWSPSPEIFTIPGLGHPVRWYGLLFALGFILAQQVMYWIFKSENKNVKDVDQLTMYLVIAVVVGARLGHCLFYNPGYYLSNPFEIIKIWEGGLASHGGAIGMLVALYLYSRKHADQSYMWILDRVAIVTVLVGACIRIGNFMNSEIIGLPTGSENGIVFARSIEDMFTRLDPRIEEVSFEKGGEATSTSPGEIPMQIELVYKRGVELQEDNTKLFFETTIPRAIDRYYGVAEHMTLPVDQPAHYEAYMSRGEQHVKFSVLGIPRHPGQLYEAIACIFMFLILAHIWYHHRMQIKTGFLFGLFMVMLWSERFTVEFFKENQEAWEASIPLNMGQWLSVPMFLIGVVVLVKSWGFTQKKEM
ncbi:prolipoprotein diacylglyceryl transferase [Reichenbachiella agariperforans]|uniref:Phosphatidylglycerol--prolipoprotein diacylglyceryl transferase n=1 Tax=Reichenbachiella agariperforans TaxID=156994 RepID=A0A1M6TK56_REIAG|nr:prolipoprotein diacylglyceryl transferase [Reichenbachiella agariperforans]SHK57341.1 prolipoprotein diacylglyceryl transferase [Reichenbachiella agariperforans]